MSWPWLEHPSLEFFTEDRRFYSNEAVHAWKVDVVDTLSPNNKGPFTAWCDRDRRPMGSQRVRHGLKAPNLRCTCGYYAWKTLELAKEHMRAYTDRPNIWRVELTGRVIEHERGYRAQYMRALDKVHTGEELIHLHGGPNHAESLYVDEDQNMLLIALPDPSPTYVSETDNAITPYTMRAAEYVRWIHSHYCTGTSACFVYRRTVGDM